MNPAHQQLVHILSVMEDLPGTLRGVTVNHADLTVTFTLSYEDSCRQCHMGRVQGCATLTFDEMLMKDPEPDSDGVTYYLSYEVRDLISKRWEEDLAAKRAKGYRYE